RTPRPGTARRTVRPGGHPGGGLRRVPGTAARRPRAVAADLPGAGRTRRAAPDLAAREPPDGAAGGAAPAASPRLRGRVRPRSRRNGGGLPGPAPSPGPPRRPQDGAGRLLRRPARAGTVPAGGRGGRCPPTPEPRAGIRRRRLGRPAVLHHGVDGGGQPGPEAGGPAPPRPPGPRPSGPPAP